MKGKRRGESAEGGVRGGGGGQERGRGRKKVDAEQGHAGKQGVRERDRGCTGLHLRHHGVTTK